MKVTKLWGVWLAYKGNTHTYIKELHDIYGPTIRIGPNELSTTEKEFIPQILGNQGMPKGPLWDGRRFSGSDSRYDSLIGLRDSVVHARLRKSWNQAFSSGPLQDYEALLLERVVQLNQCLAEIAQNSSRKVGQVEITMWIDRFSFDFMGDLAFGGAFQLMKKGSLQEYQVMEDGLFLISILQHVPWITQFLCSIPVINSSLKKFIKFGIENGLQRAGTKCASKDMFYYIAKSSEPSHSNSPMIISNVLLAIVAGSDTAATVLSSAIYFLLRYPQKYKRMQEEIDGAFYKHELPDILSSSAKTLKPFSDVLGHLPYLNAVINESMRLFPPVATGLQRAPAKDSVGRLLKGKVSDIYLPEGNAISVPPYVIHRDPRYFSPHPNSFIPERWISSTPEGSSPDNILTRDAFIPFSFGPQNCVGRPLALMELRYALSTLVRNFNMAIDSSAFDPTTWEQQFKDRFLLSKGKIGLLLSVRR